LRPGLASRAESPFEAATRVDPTHGLMARAGFRNSSSISRSAHGFSVTALRTLQPRTEDPRPRGGALSPTELVAIEQNWPRSRPSACSVEEPQPGENAGFHSYRNGLDPVQFILLDRLALPEGAQQPHDAAQCRGNVRVAQQRSVAAQSATRQAQRRARSRPDYHA